MLDHAYGRIHRPSEPTVYLHVGTHKTGTTVLQRRLATNDEVLLHHDVHVPRAGRLDADGGHHNLAWELYGDERFQPACGGLEAVLDEIARTRASTVCISAEDLEFLHAAPDTLLRMRSAFAGLDYRTIVVIYLRAQSGYCESLYAELVKHGYDRPFFSYFESLMHLGEVRFGARWRYAFEYDRMLDVFATIFDDANVIVRPYIDPEATPTPADDFMRLIGIDPIVFAPPAVKSDARLNTRSAFADIVRRYRTNRGVTRAIENQAKVWGKPFDPLALGDVMRIAERFGPGNERIRERFGVEIPFVSPRDLLHDVVASVGLDPRNAARRHFLINVDNAS